MIDTPQIVHTKPQLTAAIHLTIPKDQIREVMQPGLTELMSTLAAQGIKPAGHGLTTILGLLMTRGISRFVCQSACRSKRQAG